LDDFRESRGSLELDGPAGAEAERGFRRERVDLPGGFFVGVHALESCGGPSERFFGADHLEPSLRDALEAAPLADGGVRGVASEKGTGAPELERALGVVADDAGSGFR